MRLKFIVRFHVLLTAFVGVSQTMEDILFIDDCEASYTGGWKKLRGDIETTIPFPKECVGYNYNLKIVVRFHVEVDNSLTFIKILRPLEVPIEIEQAVRDGIVKLDGFVAPICYGKKTRTSFDLPIIFKE